MGAHTGCRWCAEDGAPVEAVLERPLLDKLGGEVARYQNKAFLKAAVAVCTLVAIVDGPDDADVVNPAERCAINHAIRDEPALADFDTVKASQILDEYLEGLIADRAETIRILRNKVGRMAGDRKMARTLMRVAYLVIAADFDIDDRETHEFVRLCRLLELDANEVWRDAVWRRAGLGAG